MAARRRIPRFWRAAWISCDRRRRGTDIPDGTEVYVDSTGIVNTEPTDEDREATARKYANKPIADFDGKGVLADGTRVPLYANVGDGKSAEKARLER